MKEILLTEKEIVFLVLLYFHGYLKQWCTYTEGLKIVGQPTEICKVKQSVIYKRLGDFMKKIKNNSTIPNDSILVTADVVRLYSIILHEAGFKALEKALNNHWVKSIQIRSYFWVRIFLYSG